MADTEQLSKDEVEKVASHLEKYAQDAQLATLEDLAKVAVFQEATRRKRPESTPKTGSRMDASALYRSLAASVGLGRS